MPDNGGLQLLPQTRKKIEIHAPGQNKLLVFSLLFLGLLAALYGGLMFYRDSLLKQLDSVEQDLISLEKNRDRKNENELLELRDKLRIIRPLIGSHIFWSDGFNKLQSLINPQVQVDSLSANLAKKEFSLKARTPNYTTLAKQIAAFYGNEIITEVVLGKVTSLTTGNLEFNLQLNFDANKLLKRNLPKK